VHALLLASSGVFAWSMGSHYTGSVAGTAYGANVFSVRTALLLTAALTVVGSVAGSVNVVGTYTRIVAHPSTVDLTAAQVAAASVTTASTYYKLPTSTIQIYAFSLLGAALVGGLPIDGSAFAVIVAGWAIGPLAAFVLGFALARLGLRVAARGERALRWALVGIAIYSAFILGSNDVSNAASSLVASDLLSTRVAGLFGGLFMALGVLTWGGRMLARIAHDILPLDVPLAATAQFAKALALSGANALGYNASINQTIVGGLVGAGASVARSRINRRVVRNIALNWTLSPLLGLASSALATAILETIVA
jgi:PiT family inorganic phosphate transporter